MGLLSLVLCCFFFSRSKYQNRESHCILGTKLFSIPHSGFSVSSIIVFVIHVCLFELVVMSTGIVCEQQKVRYIFVVFTLALCVGSTKNIIPPNRKHDAWIVFASCIYAELTSSSCVYAVQNIQVIRNIRTKNTMLIAHSIHV